MDNWKDYLTERFPDKDFSVEKMVDKNTLWVMPPGQLKFQTRTGTFACRTSPRDTKASKRACSYSHTAQWTT
ncbi:MAG: hypothetical protein KF775_16990 [Cyclobacteriaceae bacterium]|nr:hypothetical protein [Cyclobacteriaceae bacterium]